MQHVYSFVAQIFLYIESSTNFIRKFALLVMMTGANKKMNYPVFYHVRVNEKMLKELKKIGSKKVREHLEKL